MIFEELKEIFNRHKQDIDKFVSNTALMYSMKLDLACEFPLIHTTLDTLYKRLRIDDNLIKEIIDESLKNSKYKNIKLVTATNVDSQFLIMLFVYYNQLNESNNAIKSILIFLCRSYSILMRKYLKYCDQSNFYKTLDFLNKSHLFVKYKSIFKGILYLATTLYKKYRYINSYKIDDVIKLIIEGRHRINQSCKSFTNTYLKLKKESKRTSVDDETISIKVKQDISNKYIDNAIKYLFLYKTKYTKIIPYIQAYTKLRKTIVERLINNIYTLDEENIRQAYSYFFSELPDVKILEDKYKLTKFTISRLAVKVTKKEKYFKQQINDILQTILVFDPDLKRVYEMSSNATKLRYLQVIALYLALSLSLSNNLIS